MATALHGKDSVILSDQYNLQSYFKNFSFKRSKKAEEATVFGQTDRTYAPGLQDGSVSGGGLYKGNASASDSDAVLRAALADIVSGNVLSCGFGGTAIGKRGRVWLGRETNYSVDVNNDGLIATSFDSASNDGLDNAVSLHDVSVAETTTTLSTSVDQGALSTMGAVAHLHVTAFSGTPTNTPKVQHSVDNSAFTDLITFTATGAALTSERKEVAVGVTINRYVRCSSTIAGGTPSYNYAMFFARRYDVSVASVSVEFLPQGGSAPKAAFEALPTSFEVTVNNDGLITFTSEFQPSGAITDTGTGTAVAGAHGKNQVIKIDDKTGSLVDLSANGRTASLKRARKDEDSTVFGKSRTNKEQGLRSATFSFSGIWDTGLDDHFAGILG